MHKFNDFIIGDFIDSYRNLTLKTFTGYKYFNEFCLNNKRKLVLMHDDDTLINEANFNSHFVNFNKLEMIKKGWDHTAFDTWTLLFKNPIKDENDYQTICLLDKWSFARVIRPDDFSRSEYERDHYSVRKEEYDHDYYPTYCGGPCTLLTGSTMQKSYATAKITNPGNFIMEDRDHFIKT